MSSPATVIVVGGGVIGVASAWYLHKAGFKVTLIERGTVGGACSHGNLGMICPSHVLPLAEPGALLDGIKSLFNPRAAFRIKPQMRWSLLEWLLRFTWRCQPRYVQHSAAALQDILESSMAGYRELFDEQGNFGEFDDRGLLYALRTPAGLEAFGKSDDLLSERFGITSRFIEGDALPALDPALRDGLAGGFLYEEDGWLRADTLMNGWTQRLRAAGVDIIEGCELQDVERRGAQLEALLTSTGRLQAEHYVFAAGAWSSTLASALDCKLPVEPGKGYSVTVKPPTDAPLYTMLFPEHRVGISPFAEGFRLGSMMEFAGFDSQIPEHRIEQLKESAQPYLRDIGGAELERWYGWRPMTWDSLPIIGRLPRCDNAVITTGHNMIGMSCAPATGRLVAELLTEQEPHIPIQAFSPERF